MMTFTHYKQLKKKSVFVNLWPEEKKKSLYFLLGKWLLTWETVLLLTGLPPRS